MTWLKRELPGSTKTDFRHGLGQLAFVEADQLLDGFGVGEALLPLPMTILLHLLCVVAQIECVAVQLVGNLGVLASGMRNDLFQLRHI